jgi:hypothetical protein
MSHQALPVHPTLTLFEPLIQKLKPMALQPAIPKRGFCRDAVSDRSTAGTLVLRGSSEVAGRSDCATGST